LTQHVTVCLSDECECALLCRAEEHVLCVLTAKPMSTWTTDTGTQ